MRKILATCLALTLSLTCTFGAAIHAKDDKEQKDKIQVDKLLINKKHDVPSYISGNLSLPSKDKLESIVMDYLGKEKSQVEYTEFKKFKNEQNQTVIKTNQTYKGVKVKGTMQSFIIGEDGVIKTISGINIPDIASKVKGGFTLKEKEVLQIVKNDLKREFGENDFVSVEKLIIPQGEEALYVYSVKASFKYPGVESWEYTVNASNGQIIGKKDALMYENVQIDGYGPYGEFRQMNGWTGTIPDLNIVPEYQYSLADLSKSEPAGATPMPFKVLTYELGNGYGGQEITSDADGHFVEDQSQYHAVDAHYHASLVYDFYKEKFGRYSYDNKGSNIISNCHALTTGSPNNAFWDPNTKQMYFGDGDGTDFFGFSAESDVMGHEFTHAVVMSESDIVYLGESGAINEGLADLFGEAFETFVSQQDPDWCKLSKCYTPDIPGDSLLDFKNPRLTMIKDTGRGYPDHMDNVYNGSRDNSGVHINAAILTKAFWLMSEGGTFRNVNVNGIGLDKVTSVMYKVITEYITTYTNFSEFAAASLDAADVLYGKESAEYRSIESGFRAVGILNDVSQWKNISELNTVIYPGTFSYAQVNDNVYIIGGGDEIYSYPFHKKVWEYNLSTNQWNRKNDMNKGRGYGRSVSINNKVYTLFGRETDTKDALSYYYTTVDEYNPDNDQWTTVTTLPEKTVTPYNNYAGGTVVNNNSITKRDTWIEVKTGQLPAGNSIEVRLEGSDDNINFTSLAYLGKITESNTTTKFCWNEDYYLKNYYRISATVNGGSCPFGITAPYIRENSSVIAHNGKIYIIGGTNINAKSNPSLSPYPIYTMDIFDTSTNQWIVDQPGISYTRENPTLLLVTVNNQPKIYVFFGGSSKMELYDINSETWNHNAGTVPYGINCNDSSAAIYKDKIHFSVEKTDGAEGATVIYDLVTGNWTKDVDVGVPSFYGASAAYQGDLYNISSRAMSEGSSLKAEKYEPLRISAFENDNSIVLKWSKFNGSTNVLTIDGETKYTGPDGSYRYDSFMNQSKKHLIRVDQNHPVYGSINSKYLCTTYQIIGDINQDNLINSTDYSLLKRIILGITIPTNLQNVAADINKDNSVDSTDYNIMGRYILQNSRIGYITRVNPIIFGDVDYDGDVDEDDYNKVYESVSTGSALTIDEIAAADVDGNGVIDTVDYNYIQQYISNNDVIFPAVN